MVRSVKLVEKFNERAIGIPPLGHFKILENLDLCSLLLRNALKIILKTENAFSIHFKSIFVKR